MKRGARRFESQSDAVNLGHVAVENPGGQRVLVLTNVGNARTIQIYQGLKSAVVAMKENSIATLVWN
jgi:O-glycosyl hydrolase